MFPENVPFTIKFYMTFTYVYVYYIRQVNRVQLADILFLLLYVRACVCAHSVHSVQAID